MLSLVDWPIYPRLWRECVGVDADAQMLDRLARPGYSDVGCRAACERARPGGSFSRPCGARFACRSGARNPN